MFFFPSVVVHQNVHSVVESKVQNSQDTLDK